MPANARACSTFLIEPDSVAANASGIFLGYVQSERYLRTKTIDGESYRPRLVTVVITDTLKGKAPHRVESDVTSCGVNSPALKARVLVIRWPDRQIYVSADRSMEAPIRAALTRRR